MNPLKLLACSGYLVTAMTLAALGDAKPSATNDGTYSVKLKLGKEVSLARPAVEILGSNAVQLVESSNFNSVNPPANSWPDYGVAKTQDAYRQTISGKYLLVSFTDSRIIKTVGGDLKVKEIVVDLNRKDLAGPIYTIDGEGRVVSHGKYSGPLCVHFMEQVNKVADKEN
jgi:hypothetical protein